MPFGDRPEAGRTLAKALGRFASLDPVILALPRGGVPVAAEVAAALKAPLDLVLVRKIGLPWEPELAMGAVVDGGTPLIVRNEDVIRQARVGEAEFDRVRDRELAEIESRRRRYLGGRPPIDLEDRVAIVIDDGIATGATMRAALRATRMRGPKTLVLAVPVASTEALAELREEADEVVCLEAHDFLGAIGLHYSDFRQTSDEDVIEAVGRHASGRKGG
jgi:putative phosphoribosyl transferase